MAGPRRNPARPFSRAHRGASGGRAAMIDLPATGCTLPVPPLPDGRVWSKSERARWRELWKSSPGVHVG